MTTEEKKRRSYPSQKQHKTEDEDDFFHSNNNENETNLLPSTLQESHVIEDKQQHQHQQTQQLRQRQSNRSKPLASQFSRWIERTTNRMNSTNTEDGRGKTILYTNLQHYYFKFKNSVLFYIVCLLILVTFVFVWNPFEAVINTAVTTIDDNGDTTNKFPLEWIQNIKPLLEKDATSLTENDFKSRSIMFHYEELVQRMIKWMKSHDEQCSTIRHYRLNLTMSVTAKVDVDIDDINAIVIFTKNRGNDPIIMWNPEIENTYGKLYMHAEYSDFMNNKKNVSRATGVSTRYTEWQSPNDYNTNKKYRSKSPDEARCILHCIDVNSAGKHLNTFLFNERQYNKKKI